MTQKKKTFNSLEEVVKAYWPPGLQEQQAEAPSDAKAAGEELGRRVVETFGRDLAAQLQTKK